MKGNPGSSTTMLPSLIPNQPAKNQTQNLKTMGAGLVLKNQDFSPAHRFSPFKPGVKKGSTRSLISSPGLCPPLDPLGPGVGIAQVLKNQPQFPVTLFQFFLAGLKSSLPLFRSPLSFFGSPLSLRNNRHRHKTKHNKHIINIIWGQMQTPW